MPGIATPFVQIFHGKYLDEIDTEIPTEHIDPSKQTTIVKAIEQGKPGFPSMERNSIVLENLNVEGEERYPQQWFLDNSLTAAEGAQNAIQIFFRVLINGKQVYTGYYTSKSYSKNNTTVTIELEDALSLLMNDKRYLLKPFKIKGVYGGKKGPNTSYNTLDAGWDLDDNAYTHSALYFRIGEIENSKTYVYTDLYHLRTQPADYEDPVFENEIFPHLGEDFDFTATMPDRPIELESPAINQRSYSNGYETFVQIGDTTLLTNVRIGVNDYYYFYYESGPNPSIGETTYYDRLRKVRILYLIVWHADNGKYSESQDGETFDILESGHYYDSDKGEEISKKEHDITLWEPDRGQSNDILLKSDPATDIPPWGLEWLFGCRYAKDLQANELNIIQTDTDHFDVLDLLSNNIGDGLAPYINGSYNVINDTTVPTKNRRVFWSDLSFIGWLDDPESLDVYMVDVARQINAILYANEAGELVFHDRLHWKPYIDADQLVPGSIEMSEPYEESGGTMREGGYESFSIEYDKDRIPIQNVFQEDKITASVDKDGVRKKASLRDKDLQVANYRIGDLGVPLRWLKDKRKVYRYSPEDTENFPSSGTYTIDDFLPLPTIQAQRFAQSQIWPQERRSLKMSMLAYETVTIGSYLHETKNDTTWNCYFVERIGYNPNNLMMNVVIKKVGEVAK